MTVYTHDHVVVYAELAGALRLARSARAFVTDTITGLPVDVTQGARTAAYVDTDTDGRATFTATTPNRLRLTSGATFLDVWPIEVTGPDDATVAGLLGMASATRTAADARYVTDTELPAAVAVTAVTKDSLVINVLDHGATGNGSTDDTAAIQAAINSLPTAGGTVYFPGGFYRVTAPLTTTLGVHLVGASRYASVIITTVATGNILELGDACRVEHLRFTSTVARTSGAHIYIGGAQSAVHNCSFAAYYVGIQVGTTAVQGLLAWMDTLVFDGVGITAAGSGGIWLRHQGDCRISNVVMTCAGSFGDPQPSFGIRVQTGDTWFIRDVNIVRHGAGLLVDPPAGEHTYAGMLVNAMFDGAGTTAEGARSSAVIAPAGGVWDMQFSGCYFGHAETASGCSVTTTGAGVVDGMTFTGCEFIKNAARGLYVAGSAVKNWTVTGGAAYGNATNGIEANLATVDFAITGVRSGTTAVNTPQAYGIALGIAAQNRYIITNNLLTGNASGGLYDGTPGTPSRVVANNL